MEFDPAERPIPIFMGLPPAPTREMDLPLDRLLRAVYECDIWSARRELYAHWKKLLCG